MNNKGEWGVATNIEGFSFAVATENQEPIVYLTKNKDGNVFMKLQVKNGLIII